MSAQALETVNAAVRIRIESRKEELERMVADAEEMENDLREGESRAYDLGLLPVLEKGGLRTPKNIKAAVDFLDAEGAESLADIVKYNLLDDFFNAIGVDPGRRALVGKLKDAIRERDELRPLGGASIAGSPLPTTTSPPCPASEK